MKWEQEEFRTNSETFHIQFASENQSGCSGILRGTCDKKGLWFKSAGFTSLQLVTKTAAIGFVTIRTSKSGFRSNAVEECCSPYKLSVNSS